MSPTLPRSLPALFLFAMLAVIGLGAAGASGIAQGPVLATALLAACALLLAWRQVRRIARAEDQAQSALARGAQDSLALLRMTEALQRCREPADVARIAAETTERLLPGTAARLRLRPRRAGAESCTALRLGRMVLSEENAGCAACEAALCVPVAADGAVHGVLQLGGTVAPRAARAQRMALAIAEAAGFALGSLALRDRLRGQALRDPLTGLPNRRFLEEAVARLPHQAPLAVAMLDLDHFKRLNDEHGHACGDAVLRDVGALLSAGLRRSDVACRYGGEEFLLILPGCDAVRAWARMDALRQGIVARRLGGTTGCRVTCSIGVSALAEGSDIAAAIAEADAALYAAKRAGRNRVVLASRVASPADAALREVAA